MCEALRSSGTYVLLVTILVTSQGAYSITTNQSCETGKCSELWSGTRANVTQNKKKYG